MKEFKKNNIQAVGDIKNQIVQNIVEFYQIQSGLSASILEKLEEYLVLMNSFVVEALEDINQLAYKDDIQEDILDILNTYINSVKEENSKIFTDQELDIQPFVLPENNNINEIQILEYFQKVNKGELNRFNLREHLQKLDEQLYDKKFISQLLKVSKELILAINSEIIVKVEDLI